MKSKRRRYMVPSLLLAGVLVAVGGLSFFARPLMLMIIVVMITVVLVGGLIWALFLIGKRAWHALDAASFVLFLLYLAFSSLFAVVGLIGVLGGVVVPLVNPKDADIFPIAAGTAFCSLSSLLTYRLVRMTHKARPALDVLKPVWMIALFVMGLAMALGSLLMTGFGLGLALMEHEQGVPINLAGVVGLGFSWLVFYQVHGLLEDLLAPFKGERRASGDPILLPDLARHADSVTTRLEARLNEHAGSDITLERRKVRLGLERRECIVARLIGACAVIRVGVIGRDLCLRSSTYCRGPHGFWSFVFVCFETLSAPFVWAVGARLSDKLRKPLNEIETEDAKMLTSWVRRSMEAEAERLRGAGTPIAASEDHGGFASSKVGFWARVGGMIETLISFARSGPGMLRPAGAIVQTVGLVLLLGLVVGILLRSREPQTTTGLIRVGIATLLGYVTPETGFILLLWTRLPLALAAVMSGCALAAKMSEWLPDIPRKSYLPFSFGVIGAVLLVVCGVWPVLLNLVIAAVAKTGVAETKFPAGPLLWQFACYLFLGGGLAATQLQRLRRGPDEPKHEPGAGVPLSGLTWLLDRCGAFLRRYLMCSVILLTGVIVWRAVVWRGYMSGDLMVRFGPLVLLAAVAALSLYTTYLIARFLASLFPGRRVAEQPGLLMMDAAEQEAALMDTVECECATRDLPYELKRVTLSRRFTARSYLRVRLEKLATFLRASSIGRDLCVVYYCQADLGAGLLERIFPRDLDPFDIEDVKMMCTSLDRVIAVAADHHGIDRSGGLESFGRKESAALHDFGFKKA